MILAALGFLIAALLLCMVGALCVLVANRGRK